MSVSVSAARHAPGSSVTKHSPIFFTNVPSGRQTQNFGETGDSRMGSAPPLPSHRADPCDARPEHAPPRSPGLLFKWPKHASLIMLRPPPPMTSCTFWKRLPSLGKTCSDDLSGSVSLWPGGCFCDLNDFSPIAKETDPFNKISENGGKEKEAPPSNPPALSQQAADCPPRPKACPGSVLQSPTLVCHPVRKLS